MILYICPFSLFILNTSMSLTTGKLWKLDRYAHFIYDDSSKGGRWKQYDDDESALTLAITDMHQLIISQKDTVLESHNLVTSRDWIRGIAKNSSLLIMIKSKPNSRRFRMRFCEQGNISAVDACVGCIQQLKEFFPVKITHTIHDRDSSEETSRTHPHHTRHQSFIHRTSEEVTLGDIAQALLSQETMPRAYQSSIVEPALIPGLLHLCLADPSFPAFVQQVDKAMADICNNVTS
ncbi:meiotic recombination protein REC114 [Aplysia californica]|uniref:Meiotic recombination protein REC114 n=1 Tax=Aplysia californica TaxID=6500 RepID=A0ABM0JKQ9_APLCA|nr:meiotic recombination protein REC114 [Aplysia californica]